MNKRKTLLAVIPVCGLVAIVGSAYSAWYFNEDTLSKSQSLSITLTDKVTSIGELTMDTETLHLELDQGGYDKLTDGTVGITVKNASNAAVDAIDASYAIDSDQLALLTEAGLEGTITTTVKIDTDLLSYIKFVRADFTVGEVEGEYSTYTKSVAVSTSVDLSIACKTTTGVNEAFQYSAKPDSSTDYDALSQLLETFTSTSPIEIVYTVNFQ